MSTHVEKLKLPLLVAFRLTVFVVVLYLGAQKHFVTLEHFDGTERASKEVIKRLEQALNTNQDSIIQVRRIAERLEDKVDRILIESGRRASISPPSLNTNLGFTIPVQAGNFEVSVKQTEAIEP